MKYELHVLSQFKQLKMLILQDLCQTFSLEPLIAAPCLESVQLTFDFYLTREYKKERHFIRKHFISPLLTCPHLCSLKIEGTGLAFADFEF